MSKLVPAVQKVANVRAFLEKAKPQIALALPRHMTPDRMLRVALTSILQNPKLLDCDQASLGGALVTCAQLGLEPDPLLGQAYLVPFRNRRRNVTEVVVIPGYRGLMKLARNSGEIATIDAHAVHAKDKFIYEYGLTPILRHTPCQEPGDPGQETHYYAVATMKAGGGQFIVMTKAAVEAHRDRFVTNMPDDSAWRSDFTAMALKTCIRQLAKFLPASVELQRAATLDEHAEAGIPQDLGSMLELPEGLNGDAPTTRLDKLADALEKKPEAIGEVIETAAAEHAAVLDRCVELVQEMKMAPDYLARLQAAHLGKTGWEGATLDGLVAMREALEGHRVAAGKS